MIGGFELFREFEQFRMLVFGGAMVAIMVWRPRGLIATRVPSVFLHKRKTIPAAIVTEARTENAVMRRPKRARPCSSST